MQQAVQSSPSVCVRVRVRVRRARVWLVGEWVGGTRSRSDKTTLKLLDLGPAWGLQLVARPGERRTGGMG